jgi:predicted Fe-S protein YdhL (DUF1289 family)
VKSPCVKVCQMDPARNLCIGCLRTLDEILAELQERRLAAASDLAKVPVPPLA